MEFGDAAKRGLDDEFALRGVAAFVLDGRGASRFLEAVQESGVGELGLTGGRVAEWIKQPGIDRADGEEEFRLDVGALILRLLVLGVVFAHVLENLPDGPK